MFGSLSRRLTAWYVTAAILLVTIVAAIATFFGFVFYAQAAQAGVETAARSVASNERGMAQRHVAFETAAHELEERLNRPGLVVRVLPPLPPEIRGREGGERRVRPVDIRAGIVLNTRSLTGRPEAGPPPGPPPRGARVRMEGDRLGLALAAVLGIRPVRVPFMGGVVVLWSDPAAFSRLAVAVLAMYVPLILGVALLAWLAGRAMARRAVQPLVEVTEALQRFAAGDFSPQPIAVRNGGDDLKNLALAYNAAADQVAQAFDERRAAEAQMRQFVADAGHELRTPLTIVYGYLDLLRRRSNDDERTRRIFDTIQSEGARMRTLVDNLVLLARLEGDAPVAPEPFSIGALVDEIVIGRRVLAPGIPFRVEREVDATVIADRVEMHEAIANLVDNAIKYAPGSPIEIAVRAAPTGIDVVVRDHGPGIAEADRAHIFERFYRGVTRGEVEGSGLGLAIAARAVARAGGTLSLASSDSDGTTFVVRLRADEVTVERPEPVEV